MSLFNPFIHSFGSGIIQSQVLLGFPVWYYILVLYWTVETVGIKAKTGFLDSKSEKKVDMFQTYTGYIEAKGCPFLTAQWSLRKDLRVGREWIRDS